MTGYIVGFGIATLLWLAVLRELGRRQDRETARLRQELRTADAAREAMRQRLAEAEADPETVRRAIDGLVGSRTVFDDLEDESGSYGV